MVLRLGQQLLHSSLLFEGHDFPRFRQLWMHPIVSAAAIALQLPQLNLLLEPPDTEALELLAWYGANEAGPLVTGSCRQQAVCESATAAVLALHGQREFLAAIRETVRSSCHLAALWQQCPRQAHLLLSSLAKLDGPATMRVGYGLLRCDKGERQEDCVPMQQAVRCTANLHASACNRHFMPSTSVKQEQQAICSQQVTGH